MNKNTLFIAIFLGMLAPQAQATIYVGVGASYKLIDIDDVSGFNKGKTFGDNKDVEIPYTYADAHQGLTFLAGYRFKGSPWAVELNYFKSTVSKSKYVTSMDPVGLGDIVRADTKIQVESFSVDMIGHYPLSNFNKVSLLGSVGILYQKIDFVGEYDMAYLSAGGEVDFDNENKKDIFDTRLQLGVGMQYDLSEAISTRAMLSVIPSGFSMTKGTPYSMNASVLYHF